MSGNVLHLIPAEKKDIRLHNGERFKTVAEHEAYVRGIDHACASMGQWIDNLRNNARIIQNEDSITGRDTG